MSTKVEKSNVQNQKSNVTKNRKKVVKKVTTKKKQNLDNEKLSNIIKNSKNLMNDENLLNLDLSNLDENNFNKLLDNVTKNVSKKKSKGRTKLYKIETNQSIRTKIRKQRNNFINNVLYYVKHNNKKELKNEIELFNKFYKETYLLNDYSINSIGSNNSDNETLIRIKMFFQLIKKHK